MKKRLQEGSFVKFYFEKTGPQLRKIRNYRKDLEKQKSCLVVAPERLTEPRVIIE